MKGPGDSQPGWQMSTDHWRRNGLGRSPARASAARGAEVVVSEVAVTGQNLIVDDGWTIR